MRLEEVRRNAAMKRLLGDESGSALLLAIGVLVILAGIAAVIVSIAVSEKKSQFAEFTHDRAFYSADAAGEGGINWLKGQLAPPPLLDVSNNVYLSGGYSALSTGHSFKYDIRYLTKRFRPGWSLEYRDYEYLVSAAGASVQQADAAVEVDATRLYKEGY